MSPNEANVADAELGSDPCRAARRSPAVHAAQPVASLSRPEELASACAPRFRPILRERRERRIKDAWRGDGARGEGLRGHLLRGRASPGDAKSPPAIRRVQTGCHLERLLPFETAGQRRG